MTSGARIGPGEDLTVRAGGVLILTWASGLRAELAGGSHVRLGTEVALQLFSGSVRCDQPASPKVVPLVGGAGGMVASAGGNCEVHAGGELFSLTMLQGEAELRPIAGAVVIVPAGSFAEFAPDLPCQVRPTPPCAVSGIVITTADGDHPLEPGTVLPADHAIQVQALANGSVDFLILSDNGSKPPTKKGRKPSRPGHENNPPYFFGGDEGGVANGWNPEKGSHMLMARPYAGEAQPGPARTVLVEVR